MTIVRRSARNVLLLALVACSGAEQRTKGPLAPVANLTTADVEAAARPTRVALVVGIDDFEDPFWPELEYAAKDARDVAHVLRDERLGAFDDVVLLDRPEQTTRAGILEAFAELRRRAPRKRDVLVVYVSSHGTLAPDPFGVLSRVLVVSDTKQTDLLGTGVSTDEISAAFDALPSERKVMVLATCHSGVGKSLLVPEVTERLEGLKGAAPPLEMVSAASIVLSAADFGQPAREDDRLENDVYTHFLLDAVRMGADANGDGAISVSEAHDYARRQTFEYTKGRQVPTLRARIVGADPIILSGRIQRPGLPVLYGYAAGLSGVEVRSNGRDKGVLPGNVVVDSGEQRITLVTSSGATIYDDTVALEAGQRLEVDVLLRESKPSRRVTAYGGAVAFLDTAIADAALRPVGEIRVAYRMRDWPLEGVGPVLDLGIGRAGQTVQPGAFLVPQTVTTLSAGAGLVFFGDVGWFELYAGPHLAYLLLWRSLNTPGLDETQRFGAIMPGAVAGLSAPIGSFELSLESRVHYLPLVLDGRSRSVATLSLGGGLGYRF